MYSVSWTAPPPSLICVRSSQNTTLTHGLAKLRASLACPRDTLPSMGSYPVGAFPGRLCASSPVHWEVDTPPWPFAPWPA